MFDLKSKICRQSDVIFLATDLNKSSYHIIDKKEFEQFKKNLILIIRGKAKDFHRDVILKVQKTK